MIYILHMENHFLNFFLIQVNLKSQVLLAFYQLVMKEAIGNLP